MHIKLKPIDSIRPYAQNPRLNDAAVDAVAASLKEFGWRQPVVVDKDMVIVVGHTRYKAARKLGWTEVPVHVAADLTPAQARAYRIADNQTATIAEWDTALLPLELEGLKEADFDLGVLGFDPQELDRILAGPERDGLTDPDEVPPVPENPVTRPGDLWVLSEHRLLCGDSTNAKDVKRLFDGAVPFLMVTDPPLRRRVRRPAVAPPQWAQRQQAGRQGDERRPGGLDAGLQAVPRHGRLSLARGALRRRTGGQPA